MIEQRELIFEDGIYVYGERNVEKILFQCTLTNINSRFIEIEMFLNSFFNREYILDEQGLIMKNNCFTIYYIKKHNNYTMFVEVTSADVSDNNFTVSFLFKKFNIQQPIQTFDFKFI